MKETGMAAKLSLYALTWPILLEFLLFILMGTADTLMLSYLSDEVVAAVGVANQLIFFAILTFGFVATGTSIVVSQYLGAGRREEAGRVSATAITLNLLFGLFVSLMFVLFSEQALSLFKLDEKLLAWGTVYLKIVGGTLFVQSLMGTVSAILRSNGNTRDAMFVSLGMNIIHVFGNYLFIFGALGVPALGVEGVAISTAFSRTLATIVLFILLYRRLDFNISFRQYFQMKLSHIGQILKIGIPSAGEQLSYNTSQMVMTGFITLLGTAALATRVYSLNIMMYIMLFGLALGQGTQILVGHKIGAGDKEGAYRQLLRSLKISFIVAFGVAAVVALARKPLMGVFTDNPDIVATGASLLLFCLVLEPGRTFNLVVISSLRATGDAIFPVIIGIVFMWGVCVPLSYFLGIHSGLGLFGFWIAFAIDEWTRGLLMYWRWRSRAWEKKTLIHKKEKNQEAVPVSS